MEKAVAKERSVIPQMMDKHPRIAWKEYQKRRPTLDEVMRWHYDYPNSLWAIVTGQISDVIVFDFDVKDGGMETFAKLGLRATIRTPTGGAHVYCRWPGYDVKTKARVAPKEFPGMDLKADGGLATFYGKTLHGRYGLSERPMLYKPDELPSALRDVLYEQKRNPPSFFQLPPNFDDFTPVDDLLAGALELVAEGRSRNDAGFHLWCQLRDERLTFDEAEAVVLRFAEAVNVDAKQPYTAQEVYDSGVSAYSWPPRAPRRLRDGRPVIDVSGKELHDLAEEAAEAMVQTNEPPIVFVRGDVLARVVEGEDGVYVDPYVIDTFRERLSRTARWTKTKPATARSPQSTVLVRPDKDVIGFLLNKKEYEGLPALDRVVTAPVFGPDGSIITAAGYHASTKTLYRPGPDLAGLAVPETVSGRDLRAALRLVDEMIGNDEWTGFPFAGKSDRAQAVGLFLLPFLRELIGGPTPLHLIEAPTAGTGKGLAGEVLTYPGVGHIALTPEPGKDEEWRKVITSLLSRAPSIIFFDNVSDVLGGSALEAALTAQVWEDRILGVSRMMRAKIRNLWVVTSNNAKLTRDMPRRCVLIRLDADMERPSERAPENFRHPDLRGWVRANRRRLVEAALVICRAWVQEGMPHARVPLGSYEDWARIVGGVLEVSGVPGFLENRDELYVSANSEVGEMTDFLEAWAGFFGDRTMLAREVADAVSYREEMWQAAPTALTAYRYNEKMTAQLGYLLRRHKDGVFGGRKLEVAGGGGGHAIRWRVRVTEEDLPWAE